MSKRLFITLASSAFTLLTIAACQNLPDEGVGATSDPLESEAGTEYETCDDGTCTDEYCGSGSGSGSGSGDEGSGSGTGTDIDTGSDPGSGSGSGLNEGSGTGTGSGSGSGTGVTPQGPPRKPRPPCPCNAPNVPATSQAACPPDRNFDPPMDVCNCRRTDAGVGNWAPRTNPDERWQCSGTPHDPCVPTVGNGGKCSHTHHSRESWNFANGCCYKRVVRDRIPPTCH